MSVVDLALPPAGTSLCRYGASRLGFRGPQRSVEGSYIVCLGGAATMGQGVERPYPAVLELTLGLPCLNLGLPHASPDAFLGDADILRLARGAAMVTFEVTGAQNMSNRLYAVHPRRNDRFVAARAPLEALYPEVDFADFCFTRHLLGTLAEVSSQRFAVVRTELQQSWLGRVRHLIEEMDGRVVLIAPRAAAAGAVGPLGPEPLFVTAPMIRALGRYAAGICEVELDPPPLATPIERERGHEAAATLLAEVLSPHVAGPRSMSA